MCRLPPKALAQTQNEAKTSMTKERERVCVYIFPVSFCNPYRPAFLYVSVCSTDTFFFCRRVYLTIQLVHSFAGDGFKSIPQILYVYPKYMQWMKWIMTKLSPVLVVFVSFSLSTVCFITQAVLLSE